MNSKRIMSTQNQAKLSILISIFILLIVCRNFANGKPAPVRKPPFNGSIFGKRSSSPAVGPLEPPLTPASSRPKTDQQKAAKNIITLLLKHQQQQQRDQDRLQQQQQEAAIRMMASRCLAQDEILSELELLDYCDELFAFLNYEPAVSRLEQIIDSNSFY